MRAKYNKGGRTALYDLMKKYEHGGVHASTNRQDTGHRENEKAPQIDIEVQEVAVGANPDGSARTERQTQFYVNGEPVTQQDAMRIYEAEGEGPDQGLDFQDFTTEYLTRKHGIAPAGTGAGYLGRLQHQGREEQKRSAGAEGLLRGLREYGKSSQYR